MYTPIAIATIINNNKVIATQDTTQQITHVIWRKRERETG